MEFHRGRLIDHVHIVVRDLDASLRFCQAILQSLGRGITGADGYFHSDELYVSAGTPVGHVHLALQAQDRDAVARFHEAGLAFGGRDNGPPGERAYHPGYYAAFLLDPDGNNLEAVHHGPVRRSAESVVLTAE